MKSKSMDRQIKQQAQKGGAIRQMQGFGRHTARRAMAFIAACSLAVSSFGTTIPAEEVPYSYTGAGMHDLVQSDETALTYKTDADSTIRTDEMPLLLDSSPLFSEDAEEAASYGATDFMDPLAEEETESESEESETTAETAQEAETTAETARESETTAETVQESETTAETAQEAETTAETVQESETSAETAQEPETTAETVKAETTETAETAAEAEKSAQEVTDEEAETTTETAAQEETKAEEETQPETKAEEETQPETKAETEVQSETSGETEPAIVETETETQSETEPETVETETQSETEPATVETETETQSETDPAIVETETETESEAESEEIETESETESETETEETEVLSYKSENFEVYVSYTPEAKIPERSIVRAREVTSTVRVDALLDEAQSALNLESNDDQKVTGRFFDIIIRDPEGMKVEPAAPVTVKVTMTSNYAKELRSEPQVVHFEKNDTGIAPVEVTVTDSRQDEKQDNIEFQAESFSVYGIVYTVDFEYSVNGKMYQFSLPGGEKIALSDLIEVLGIIDDTNNGVKAAFNSVDSFLKEVANVEFSDESLVKVAQNEEGNDWTLESLQPFDTEESLTITMKNGDVVTVKVTDSQAGGDLAAFITDATLEIDGKTYGAGTTWNVRPDVDYRLTLNFLEKGSRQLPGGGQEITMAMPSGLSLEPGVNGSFDIPCGLAGTLTGNTWWVDDNGILHIKFADDPDDLLTRSSNIHFDLALDAKFDGLENHFEFNNNVIRDAKFNYDTDVDVQKSGSYNASTGKMEYTVTVKSTGKSENVTVSDVISGNMLTLDENSFEITPSSKTPSSTSTNSKGFTMTFGEMAHNETVTIKYTASVDTSKIGPGGKVTGDDGKNSVTVANDDNKTDTDENITNTIKFSDIAKSSTSSAETADGEKVEMEWKITANEGQLGSIKGSKITDTIDHGSKDIMHYVVGNDGKLALSVKKIAPNGTSTTETVYVDVSKTYDQGPETWTWIPQDEGNYAYEITYKTLVTKQTENTTVKNDTSNESGGSTSGTGVVPGTNPGGGGSGTDDIVGGKAAVAVTPEYIDWDIVVAIQPGDDFTNRFVIVDEIPNGANLGHKFADTFDSILSVTGLNDHEDYTYEVTKEDHNNLSPKQKDILTITFWQDKAHTDSGIDKGARTITVRIRTKNDPDWVNFADTAGGGEKAIYHTNSAKVNDSNPFTDKAAPLHTKIDKEKESNLSPETIDGVQLPRYEYSVTLTNVTELPVVITDSYDPNELVFVGEGQATGWNGHHGIAAATQKNNLNNPDSNYHATFSADNETGTLTITANSLPTKPDGSYYEFYRIYYTMRVKDADALDSFTQQAIANGGTYLIGNTAEWNGDDDHVDVEYKVPGLSKEGYFSSSSNNRQYTFILDVNRNGLEMNGGENMDLLDSHTKNLSVDYSTVKVYKITDGQSFDDAKKYQLNESMLTNEVTWNFDANEGTFSIPDRTHYVITYNALIIGSGNKSFKNEAELKGYHASKEDSKDYGSDSHAGGSIPEINLLKYEAGQTSKGLQGAVFQLFKGTGEYDPVTGDEIKEELKYGKSGTRADGTTFTTGENITFTTGVNGTVKIALNQTQHGEQLDTGVHYYLKEINSPPGYQIDSSVEYWEFTLTDDPDEVNYGDPDRRDERGRRQWIYFSYGDILKMANKSTVEPLNVVVNKQWFDEDGNEIRGENLNQGYKATIQLMRKTDSGDYVKVKVTGSGSNLTVTEVSDNSGEIELNSDNNWAYTWSQLPRVAYGGQGGMEIIAHYAYKVEEVSVEGYVSSVSETENETTKTYALKNYKVPEDRNTEITVNKVWQDVEGNVIPGTTEKLPGNITFSIYQVTSKTPFTRVPSSGGNKYIISGDSHLLEGGTDDTNDNYGLYRIQRGENWTATFSNLPSVVTANGETTYYAYYVKEEALAGYKTTYTSDGTTRTIVNREPLDEDSNYIDIGLEKKWTDGTKTTPPSGASAKFTVHQQKNVKSGGSSGNLSVQLVYDDNGEEVVVCTRRANVGDNISFSYSGAPSSGTNVNVYWKGRYGGEAWEWQYLNNIGGGSSSFSTEIKDAWVNNNTVKIKVDKSFATGCEEGPAWDAGEPTWSGFTDTEWKREVTLPTTAGAWSTTIKDLIQEDAEGNLYRYYITEDSCTPVATVSFKDDLGKDIAHAISTNGQKVEVTNTYENETFSFTKEWYSSASTTPETEWQGDIVVTLKRNSEDAGTYTINKDDVSGNFTATKDGESEPLSSDDFVATAGTDGKFTFTFKNLESKDSSGNNYTYSIVERKVSEYYQEPKYTDKDGHEVTGSVSNSGTVKNVHVPATFEFTKTWDNGNDNTSWGKKDGQDIELTFTLIGKKDNAEVYHFTVNAKLGYSGRPITQSANDVNQLTSAPTVTVNSDGSISINGLPSGYEYSLTEDTVSGYNDPAYSVETTQDENGKATGIKNGGTVTNTKLGGFSFTKAWKNSSDSPMNWPEGVSELVFTVTDSDNVAYTVTVAFNKDETDPNKQFTVTVMPPSGSKYAPTGSVAKVSDNYSITLEGLPSGKTFKVTAETTDLNGYKKDVTDTTVTNTKLASFEFEKKWFDAKKSQNAEWQKDITVTLTGEKAGANGTEKIAEKFTIHNENGIYTANPAAVNGINPITGYSFVPEVTGSTFKFRFDNLPSGYTYKITNEDKVDGYSSSINEQGTVVTNTELAKFSFTKKWLSGNGDAIGWDDNNKELTFTVTGTKDGAEVSYTVKATKEAVTSVKTTDGANTDITGTVTNGTTGEYSINLTNLPSGYTYTVVETSKLEGYDTPDYGKTGDNKSEAASDGGSITNRQTAQYSLPGTGGSGLKRYIGISVLLMLLAAILYINTRERRKRPS